MIWYQNRHMECVQRHVTQEMPCFKTNPSHLQFAETAVSVEYKYACSSFDLFLE